MQHLRHYPPKFGMKLRKLFADLCEDRHDPAPLTPEYINSDPKALFASQAWGDLCHDADMTTVVQYLLGNKGCLLPPEWRSLFPESL